MNILFRGLGPNESVTYKGTILKNGASLDMEDAHAEAYVSAGIAYPVHSEEEVEAAQALEAKNAETRKRIREKAARMEKAGESK